MRLSCQWRRESYFICIMSTCFRDELEGSVGYIFLAAMVVTSFHFARKQLDPNNGS